MSLLKLSPDCTRLRQVAKAHAAGEVSKLDFRTLRASVIEGFGEAQDPVPGDTTQRRWNPTQTITQRVTPVAQGGGTVTARALPVRLIAMLVLVIVLVLAGAVSAYALPPDDGSGASGNTQQASIPAIELRIQPRPASERWPFGVPADGSRTRHRDPVAPEGREQVGFRTRA